MSAKPNLPRILIIDDLLGRTVSDRPNEERANLCGQFLLEDVTGDEDAGKSGQKIKKPIARAVFWRGQQPLCSSVGDCVENDLKGTLEAIRQGWAEWRPDAPRWSMVLLDLCFYTGHVTAESNVRTPGMPEGRPDDSSPDHYFGLRLLEAIHAEFPDLPVVVLSSQPREQVSHQFSISGAFGFLAGSDPDSTGLLKDYLWRYSLIEDDAGEVVGHSKALLMALRASRRASLQDRNLHVLLRGERGVGKELLARYIHRQHAEHAKHAGRPFVVVNSAVLTPELFASELFGIEGRVATQVDQRDGLITTADGGHLFFDEIRDMVPQAQAGILRVLEEGSILPVGAREPVPVDVRFLSATNGDIESLSATGRFRGDLLDRLRSGGTLVLPPLRERQEDIQLLTETFAREAELATPGALERVIDETAIEELCEYDWPGNVRELRSCIFQAVHNHPDVEHLVPVHIELSSVVTAPQAATRSPSDRMAGDAAENARADDSDQSTDPASITLDELLATISNYEFDSADYAGLSQRLEELEGATAKLLANYLKASLDATKRPTPDHPGGKIFIHPTAKLMTGNPKLSASKAADLIKRLLNRSPAAVAPLLENSILKEALETAQRLRPSNPRKKRPNA